MDLINCGLTLLKNICSNKIFKTPSETANINFQRARPSSISAKNGFDTNRTAAAQAMLLWYELNVIQTRSVTMQLLVAVVEWALWLSLGNLFLSLLTCLKVLNNMDYTITYFAYSKHWAPYQRKIRAVQRLSRIPMPSFMQLDLYLLSVVTFAQGVRSEPFYLSKVNATVNLFDNVSYKGRLTKWKMCLFRKWVNIGLISRPISG